MSKSIEVYELVKLINLQSSYIINCNHQKLQSRLATTKRNSFINKPGDWRSDTTILFSGRKGPYFVKEQWFEEQIHRRRHNQDARASNLQHFRCLYGKGFLTDNRNAHWHKLCPTPGTNISVSYTRRNSYSPCSLPVKNCKHLSSTSHINTSMTYCQLITQNLKIIYIMSDVHVSH